MKIYQTYYRFKDSVKGVMIPKQIYLNIVIECAIRGSMFPGQLPPMRDMVDLIGIAAYVKIRQMTDKEYDEMVSSFKQALVDGRVLEV